MPKKIKKPISRKPKTKNKNVVNVKINIDNSKKTTARRTPMKPSNMQPFVNFPSFQPTRIQQLEPKSQFNSPDFTKIDDMYQKQFKTYLETTDKSVKDIIEKFDDTLKKNTAPQKTEVIKPGASNVYATDEGETVFTEPIEFKKTSMKTSEPTQTQKPNITHIEDDSNLKVGYSGWGRSNEFQGNPLTSTTSTTFNNNKILQEPQTATTVNIDEDPQEAEVFDEEKFMDEAINKATSKEKLTEKEKAIKKKKSSLTFDENYKDYLDAYKQFYNDENYKRIGDKNKKGGEITSGNWGSMATHLMEQINRYGTFDDKQFIEAEKQQIKTKNKEIKKEKELERIRIYEEQQKKFKEDTKQQEMVIKKQEMEIKKQEKEIKKQEKELVTTSVEPPRGRPPTKNVAKNIQQQKITVFEPSATFH